MTAAFLVATLGISWPLLIAGDGALVFALAFWVPGLVAIVLTKVAGGRAREDLGVTRVGWPDAYLVAYWLPIAFVLFACVLGLVLGVARLQEDIGGELPVQSLTIAPLANTFVMLGGELGWRGYLLPRLLPIGPWRAIGLVAVLWSLWQTVPQLALVSGSEWILRTAWYAVVGVLLGWLYLKTRSVWAPAFCAGTVGAVSGLAVLVLSDPVPTLAGMVSVTGLVLPVVAVLALRVVRVPDALPA